MTDGNQALNESGAARVKDATNPWGMAFFLVSCYTLSIVDRYIISFLAPSIQRNLDLTDLQLGLVQGFAFSILYAVAGLPLGAAVDRFRRLKVVAGAITIWSAMTGACGVATSFAALLAARIGVGIGEAALTPASFSIFGDIFSRKRMPLAASIYNLAPPIATACAAGLSGLVLSAAGSDGTIDISHFGPVQGWRVVLLVIALPGFAMALVALALPEPSRLSRQHRTDTDQLAPFIRRYWRLHLVFMLAAMLSALSGYAANAWNPSVLERSFHWSPSQTGAALGGIGFVCGVLGNGLGGALSSWLVGKDRDVGILLIAGGAMTVQTFAGASLFFATSGKQFLIVAGVGAVILSMIFTVVGAMLQLITPASLRGRVTALTLFITIGIGAGGGPFAVGSINTLVWHDRELDSALATILVIAPIASAVLFLSCVNPMRAYLLQER